MKINVVQNLIDSLYSEIDVLQKDNEHDKHSAEMLTKLRIIIELKCNYTDLANVYRSLYLDVKCFLLVYTSDRERFEYGYDVLSKEMVEQVVLNTPLAEEKKYILLELLEERTTSTMIDKKWLSRKRRDLYINLSKQRSFIKYLLLLSSKTLFNTFITMLMLIVVECVVLLPAPIRQFEIFSFSKTTLSSNEVVNHIANVLSLHAKTPGDVILCANNVYGVVALVFWEVFWIVIVVNFLFKNLLTRFEIDESDI